MKNSKILGLMVLFATTAVNAQIGGIDQTANDISDTIRGIFPILLGVVFLVGFLMNAGHFFGQDADIKKGISRVLVFVLVGGAVVGIFTYLTTLVV